MASDFVSLREFSRIMGVGTTTVWRWIRAGMPASQPSGRRGKILICLSEAKDWLRQRQPAERKE